MLFIAMDWHSLGHATWLAEVDGLRLLFDPLLEDRHHGGVFGVSPGRTIDAAALRPDFVFVSHRHPDHFDLASLRALVALDPDVVLVTSDTLVASCAGRLGFRTVRVVPPTTTIDLDGPRLVTTPSVGVGDPEWGVVVSSGEGVAYNQVDTSLGDPDDVRTFFDRIRGVVERGRPAEEPLVTLALARWQPLLEVEAMLAGSIGFPFRAYAQEIERCAALGARVVCPSAAGTRHAGHHGFMNRLVYPMTQQRFIDDMHARAPSSRVVANQTGATYRIRGGDVEVDPAGASSLVSVKVPIERDVRSFRPLEIPPLIDRWCEGSPEASLRTQSMTWVHEELFPALCRAYPTRSLRWLLEVVFPSSVDLITITTGPSPALTHEDDVEWDVRCAVAGSLLVEVIEGRRHWGDLLLGGALRACSRAREVDARGVRPIPLQPLFVYEAISYETSILRALDHELEG